jgi:rhodanese-related sulfurtransferase
MKKLLPLFMLFFFVSALQAQNTYREITLPELMKKYQKDASNIVIVDVRSDGEYYDTLARFKNGNIGRIKGVKHIEVQQLDKPESIKLLEPYKDKEIYLICSHSFRSRNASNILTRNGFPNVNNVQGGMTEWYRRYEELLPYRSSLETTVKYKNISSAQLNEMMAKNNDFLLIGINIVPRNFFDSAGQKILQFYPNFKKAVFFNESDSAKILGLAKKNGGKPIVLYNNLGAGAAEMADYLVSEGIPNVQYLVGGVNYFLEYAANKNLLKQTTSSLKSGNTVQFITPVYFCEQMASKNNVTVIDLRQDSLFLKVSRGIKSDYKYVQSSQNFPASKGAEEFAKAYPDKKKPYLFISRNSSEGLEMADQLSKMGYSINWLLGGIPRFDWYTINLEGLGCRDQLIRP